MSYWKIAAAITTVVVGSVGAAYGTKKIIDRNIKREMGLSDPTTVLTRAGKSSDPLVNLENML